MKKGKLFVIGLIAAMVLTQLSCEEYDAQLPDPVAESTEDPTANWSLVWSDEFDYTGLPDATKWGYEEGYVRNNEEQYYTKARLENAYVGDGLLTIKAIKESFPNKDYNNPDLIASGQGWKTVNEYAKYTSACLITQGLTSWTYGKIEMRAKLPSGSGVFPAFWTMGTNISSVGWPACGEVDIFEFLGRAADRISGGLHYRNPIDGSNAKSQSQSPIANPSSEFHSYTMIWDENQIELQLDNKTFHTFYTGGAGDIFKKPQYLLINFALGGVTGGTIDESVLPQTYQIDYVRVYQQE